MNSSSLNFWASLIHRTLRAGSFVPFLRSLDPRLTAVLTTVMPAIGLSDDSRISVANDQVSCDLAGEAAILNLKNSVYYGLDTVGAQVWSLIQTPKTFAEIRDTLLDLYDVDRPQLHYDLQALLSQLAEHGLIDIQTQPP